MSAILILFTCSIFNVQASEVIEFKDAKATKVYYIIDFYYHFVKICVSIGFLFETKF